MYALTLIDKARTSGRWRSDAEIAEAIGVSGVFFHHVTHGRKKLPPERAALLADLIGEDAAFALQRVTLENAQGDLLARLQKAFHVAAGVAGVVVLAALGSAPSPVNAGTINPDREFLTSEVIAQTFHCRALIALLGKLAKGLCRRRPEHRKSLALMARSAAKASRWTAPATMAG